MWDDLPENVAWFVRQLESSGFMETHREGGTMDSGLITFRREPVEVRLVKDRSQWSMDLTADGWNERERLNFPLFHGFALDQPHLRFAWKQEATLAAKRRWGNVSRASIRLMRSVEREAVIAALRARGVSRAWRVASPDADEVILLLEGDDLKRVGERELTQVVTSLLPGRKVWIAMTGPNWGDTKVLF